MPVVTAQHPYTMLFASIRSRVSKVITGTLHLQRLTLFPSVLRMMWHAAHTFFSQNTTPHTTLTRACPPLTMKKRDISFDFAVRGVVFCVAIMTPTLHA